METISATELRSKCYEILDRAASGEIETLTITKRVRPTAVLSKPTAAPSKPAATADEIRALNGFMRGSVIIPEGFDLTAPVCYEPFSAEEGLLHQ